LANPSPPHLAAITPGTPRLTNDDGWSYEGGACSLAFEGSRATSSLTAGAVPRLGDQSVADRLAEACRKPYAYLPIKTYPWLFRERAEVAGFFFNGIKHRDRDAM
jgi:hypothetical protein